jgi:cytochrome oxidase assembly protein ShyY1
VRRFAFLLRPGWLALLLAVLAFSGSCFLILSPWQFGRNAGREQRNAAIAASESTAPVPLAGFLAPNAEPSQRQVWRRVTVTGHYLPGKEVLARLREVNGQPAYEVVTPLRSTNGRLLLIDRGWIPVTDGHASPYAPAPTSTVHLTARVQADEHPDPDHSGALHRGGHTQVYRINGDNIGDVLGLHFRAGYFTLVPNQPGGLRPLPLPERDSGPFLSYALQWIVFGVMALFGLGYFTRRELKPGGALTQEGRAQRRAQKAKGAPEAAKPVRGRHAVAAAIADEEAREYAEADGGHTPEPHGEETEAPMQAPAGRYRR